MPLIPTIGVPELLIILVIVVIFFGVGKLPQIGKALGEGIRNFKEGQSGAGEDAGEPGDSRKRLDVDDHHDGDQVSHTKQRVKEPRQRRD